MRLLADENMPGPVVAELRARGHDLTWIREDACGLDDGGVLARAADESRLLLSLDKDFGELVFRRRWPAPFGIVLLRVRASSPGALAVVVADVLESRDDWAGCFAVMDRERVRLTPLPNL